MFVPGADDLMGLHRIVQVIEQKEFEPDVIYTTYEPGSVSAIAQVVPARIPFVAYVPIEGEPLINSSWRAILKEIDFFTCSEYGARQVKASIDKDVGFVYHGVDTESFYPMTQAERDEYRERLGWDNKFVISCVAQNVRRKQLPRLIEAVAILKNHFKQRDIVLYLHSVPFQNHWLEGWNLPEIAAGYGLTSEVVFNPLLSGFGKGVPEHGNLDVPGLRELVGSSDLFVLPSQVEGFGLPIAEAMAVGTPVAVTKYAAGWEVANLGGGAPLVPSDWEVHKSGAKYANLDPYEIAKTIISLRRNPRKLAKMREQGLAAVGNFDWAQFEEHLIARIEKAVSRPTSGSIEQTTEDRGRSQAGA